MSSASYGILEGYNPTLPSSSAVERLFSAAAQVPTARRNTQSAYLSPITFIVTGERYAHKDRTNTA